MIIAKKIFHLPTKIIFQIFILLLSIKVIFLTSQVAHCVTHIFLTFLSLSSFLSFLIKLVLMLYQIIIKIILQILNTKIHLLNHITFQD